MLRSPNQLHGYQQRAVHHQCSLPNTMMWLDVGLGKTAITLTSIAHLISTGFLRGVIIVAPIRVCRLVWRQEAAKWAHTNHLTFSMVTGDKDLRSRAMLRPADVYLINYDNLKWLATFLHTHYVSKGRPAPFNGIVWDEISKCKNSTTDRVKAFLKIEDHFNWTTGLTGTPASNGYKDLHGQYLVVDKGQRLGRGKTKFKTAYYHKEGPYKEVPFADTEEKIKSIISDITLEMSAADYNPLPDMIINDIEVEMDGPLRERYEQFEKDMFMRLDSGEEIEAFNKAALMNKCLQFSGGSIYPLAGVPVWVPLHDLKLDALEDIVEESQGSPILCAYQFRSDAARIMERFKHLNPINLTECKSERSLQEAMRKWKAGECPLMIGHAACVHPRTQVLTELRGWVRIVDVKTDERVFDGVEFVSHDGCSYSGYKPVIDVLGITMTPDHKILAGKDWRTASDLRDSEDLRAEAVYQYQGDDPRVGEMFAMRRRVRDGQAECDQAQQGWSGTLSNVPHRQLSQDDQHPHLADLATVTSQSEGHRGQKLWWARDRRVSRMGRLQSVLFRYVSGLLGRLDHRSYRREWALSQRQLSLGNQYGATIQQAEQPRGGVPGRDNAPCGALQAVRCNQDDAPDATQPWDDSGRSCTSSEGLTLREGQESDGKTHVYDLVNCGPRNRFVIRNDEGEVFISHNSMGHGIDGLQDAGNIVVWFGLTWSLDLYVQLNGRIRRQGQGKPVMCHRIMVTKTLDQVQAIALNGKASTEAGLRDAIKQYRLEKGV